MYYNLIWGAVNAPTRRAVGSATEGQDLRGGKSIVRPVQVDVRAMASDGEARAALAADTAAAAAAAAATAAAAAAAATQPAAAATQRPRRRERGCGALAPARAPAQRCCRRPKISEAARRHPLPRPMLACECSAAQAQASKVRHTMCDKIFSLFVLILTKLFLFFFFFAATYFSGVAPRMAVPETPGENETVAVPETPGLVGGIPETPVAEGEGSPGLDVLVNTVQPPSIK